MADGIVTRDEEELRAFRDELALEDRAVDQGAMNRMDRASSDRIMMEASLAAIPVQPGDGHLRDLDDALGQASLGYNEERNLLIRAWEAAVEGTLEDGLLSLGEENALAKYAAHFGLEQHDLDGNGVQTSLVQAAVVRDVTRGVVPQRQRVNGAVPFNLMKSEQLVWVIQGVDYLETVVRRERRGTSHGVSIRVARGLYYQPISYPACGPGNTEEGTRLDDPKAGNLHMAASQDRGELPVWRKPGGTSGRPESVRSKPTT